MLALELAFFWLSGQWNNATTPGVTPVFTGSDSIEATITATGDGQQSFGLGHTLGVAQEFWLVPLLPNAYLSQWSIVSSNNQLTVTKSSAVGSGNAAPQVEVFVKRPHSIGR